MNDEQNKGNAFWINRMLIDYYITYYKKSAPLIVGALSDSLLSEPTLGFRRVFVM